MSAAEYVCPDEDCPDPGQYLQDSCTRTVTRTLSLSMSCRYPALAERGHDQRVHVQIKARQP